MKTKYPKINILYDLQLSVLDSLDDGNFLFQTDSNVNVMCFTIKGLLAKNPDFTFYLLVPPVNKLTMLKEGDDLSKIYDIFTDEIDRKKVKLIEYPYYGNPFIDRVSFYPRELKEKLDNIHIDLIYTNDPSKVLTYKTFFYHLQDEFVPIISRNHWVTGKLHRKVPEEIDFMTRQVEGAYHSTFSTFNSETAIDMLLENSKEFFNDEVREKIKRTSVATETVDIEKMDAIEKTERLDMFTILWAHRLSYYTGFNEVFDALNDLWEEGYDFHLVVTDPGNKTTQKELKEKYPFIYEIDKSKWTHEDYLKMCWKADIAIGNHNIPTTWGGLSLTEPMSAYTVPLMPAKDGYLEMFHKGYADSTSNDPNVFFSDMDDMNEMIKGYMKDPNSLEHMKSLARNFCESKLSMEEYINTLDRLILTAVTF